MMRLQRRARLLVTPNNQGNFTAVVVVGQSFEGRIGLGHVGMKAILDGWDSSSGEKTLGERERHSEKASSRVWLE